MHPAPIHFFLLSDLLKNEKKGDIIDSLKTVLSILLNQDIVPFFFSAN